MLDMLGLPSARAVVPKIKWDAAKKTAQAVIASDGIALSTDANGVGAAGSIITKTNGIWYAEFQVGFLRSTDWLVGVGNPSGVTDVYAGATINSFGYYGSSGQKYNVGGLGLQAYAATYGENDVIGTTVNLQNGELTFYKNNVSQGVAYILPLGLAYHLRAGGEQSAGATSLVIAGTAEFCKYTPPAGALYWGEQ